MSPHALPSPHTPLNNAVLDRPFRESILARSVRLGGLDCYSGVFPFMEGFQDLRRVIGSRSFQLVPGLEFSLNLPFVKPWKNLFAVLEKESPRFPRPVVDDPSVGWGHCRSHFHL